MIVERETAGFVLPFAIGIIVSTFAATHSPITQNHCITLPCIAAAGVICLMHPSHKTWSGPVLWTIISVTALSCGIWIGSGSNLLKTSELTSTSMIMDAADRFCTSMKSRIEAIGFGKEETSAMIKALITGDRAGLSPETTRAFRSSGAAHILALSGLHLGIIYGILTQALSVLGNRTCPKVIRSVLIITFCGFYTLATGAGASIVRAFLFVLLGESAILSGRKRVLSDILIASLFIQIAVRPGSVTDIGFQLSYAAMAGIAFIFPKLKGFVREDRYPGIFRWIWNSAAMSISCQIATGPLAYHYFGTFPQYFLLTNLIALPITGLIIPISLLTLTLDIFGICPAFLIQVTELLITTLTGSLEIISQM